MKLLKSILDFYIRSSLHVAVCFVALLNVFHKFPNSKNPSVLNLYLLCAVVVGYNFIKYFHLVYQKKQFRFKKGIIIVTILALLTSCYFILKENLVIYFFLGLASLLSVFYAYPVLGIKNLRLRTATKIFTVVSVWYILIVFVPNYSNYLIVHQNAYGPSIRLYWSSFLIESFALFFFVAALCIPFEIRDLRYDDLSLRTLPQIIGVHKTKMIGIILLFLSLVIQLIGYNYYSAEFRFEWNYFIIILITSSAIWFSDQFKSDYYASFFVEAIPILWLGLYYLL